MHQQVYEPFQESLCRDAQTADVVAFDAESQPKMLDYIVIHFGHLWAICKVSWLWVG